MNDKNSNKINMEQNVLSTPQVIQAITKHENIDMLTIEHEEGGELTPYEAIPISL